MTRFLKIGPGTTFLNGAVLDPDQRGVGPACRVRTPARLPPADTPSRSPDRP